MTRVLCRGWVGWAMVGVTLAAFSGCADDEEGSGSAGGYCERLDVKLDDCGLSELTRDVGNECEEPTDDEDRCSANCLVSASCEDLREVVCAAEFVDVQSALTECFDACDPPPFLCGSGEEVADDLLCDGFEQCSDGSDEATDCPTCGSGEVYAEWARCDGYWDCSDGVDEMGCPTFRCANGDTVPEDAECDFYADCIDGSDEHDACPPGFECESGEVIPAYWRCDDVADCADESDEPSTCPPSAEEQICGN